MTSHGLTILVDRKATLFLIGTTMDYKTDKLTPGFTFENPNEKGRCGCGESFHVEGPAKRPVSGALGLLDLKLSVGDYCFCRCEVGFYNEANIGTTCQMPLTCSRWLYPFWTWRLSQGRVTLSRNLHHEKREFRHFTGRSESQPMKQGRQMFGAPEI